MSERLNNLTNALNELDTKITEKVNLSRQYKDAVRQGLDIIRQKIADIIQRHTAAFQGLRASQTTDLTNATERLRQENERAITQHEQ